VDVITLVTIETARGGFKSLRRPYQYKKHLVLLLF
jgi:hypothetical protein